MGPLGKGYSLYVNSLKSKLSKNAVRGVDTIPVSTYELHCIMHPGPSFKQLQRWQGIRAENRAKRLGCAREGCLTSTPTHVKILQYSIQPLHLIVDKALWPIGALLSAFIP